MKEDNFKNLDKMSGELQKQFQAFMELNAKTLQNLHYLKPDGLSGFQNPGELMSKHVAFIMENNQRFFDYAHTSFKFLEAIFAPLAQVAKENTEQSIKKAASISRKIQKPLKSAVSKKMVSRSKPLAAKKKAIKTAKSVAKSASSKAAPKLKVTKAKSEKTASKPSTPTTKMKAAARKTTGSAIKKSASKAKAGSFAQKKTHTGSLVQAGQKARSSLFDSVNDNKISDLPEHKIGHTFQGQSDKPKHPFHK